MWESPIYRFRIPDENNEEKLKDVGREGELELMNRQALKIARKLADEYKVFMAGNICNTWIFDPKDKSSHEKVRKMYDEQVKWAKEEGADLIIATYLSLSISSMALSTISTVITVPSFSAICADFERSSTAFVASP